MALLSIRRVRRNQVGFGRVNKENPGSKGSPESAGSRRTEKTVMDSEKILRATQETLNVVSPLLGRLMQITVGSADHAEQTAKTGSMEELRAEAERQELAMQMAERQAKVAQELALARRIESADDVEMEELYDVSGSAHAALKSTEGTISAGLGGQGQKVTRRVYRFKNHPKSEGMN